MKNLTITNRYSSLLEAVRANNVDLSYNEPLALADLKWLESSKDVTIDLVFTSDDGEIYWIGTVKREGLQLLHKYTPFVSCMHDGKFSVFCPVNDVDNYATLPNAAALKFLGFADRSTKSRRTLADAQLIAYAA